jgi:AcrR family transcriptional regulator
MPVHARHLSADERRASTVEAVVALAGARNPAEITTAQIADHMQLTQGALFRHFPTKDAIWLAVLEWVAEQLLLRLDHAAEGAESPLAALQAMFLANVEFVLERPGALRLVYGELQRAEPTPPPAKARAQTRIYAERLTRLVEDGKEAGQFVPDLDAEAAALVFIGAVQGLIVQSLQDDDPDRLTRDAPGVFDIFRRGILA